MSTEREPTVIERMSVIYQETEETLATFYVGKLSEMPRVVGGKAMLAAVRELRSSLSDGNNEEWFYADASDVIQLVIEDHERRAGGKGE